MIITEIKSKDREGWTSGFAIEIDGKSMVSFWNGEPEDNNLYRNFSDCYSISKLMQMAHEAGRRGEPLEIKQEERNWFDG